MKLIVGVGALLLLSGCATQHFGRVQTLTGAERDHLSCEQIDIEIAKVDGFVNDVNKQKAESGGKAFLGYMGDFGIGNSMEYNDAMKSATTRKAQLQDLKQEKQCSVVKPATAGVAE
jgi:hypothetical protein